MLEEDRMIVCFGASFGGSAGCGGGETRVLRLRCPLLDDPLNVRCGGCLVLSAYFLSSYLSRMNLVSPFKSSVAGLWNPDGRLASQ